MTIKSKSRKRYDELKFTALEVSEGDAFLLERGEWKCLFDAGEDKTKAKDLLIAKNIQRINLAICSHNDVDHSEGFIEILKSSITIDEIWFPGCWISIIRFIVNNLNSANWIIFEKLIDSSSGKKSYSKQEFSMDALYEPEANAVPVSEFKKYMTDDYATYDDYMKNPIRKRKNSKQWICIKKIMQIAKLAFDKGCIIRWLEPDYCGINSYVDYGFFALNAKPKSFVKKVSSTTNFIKLINLTIENIYSLAFEFKYNGIPVIRFSADSTCYSQTVNPYKESIIITAPHHGSCHNDIVYSLLQFDIDKTIWVKTHNRSVTKIKDFKNLKNKYCVFCCKNTFSGPERICFEYNDAIKEWQYKKGHNCLYPKC